MLGKISVSVVFSKCCNLSLFFPFFFKENRLRFQLSVFPAWPCSWWNVLQWAFFYIRIQNDEHLIYDLVSWKQVENYAKKDCTTYIAYTAQTIAHHCTLILPLFLLSYIIFWYFLGVFVSLSGLCKFYFLFFFLILFLCRCTLYCVCF